MSKHKPSRPDSRRAQLRAAQIAEAKRAKNKKIAIAAVVTVAVIAVVAAIALGVNRFRQAEAANVPPNATSQRDAIVVNPDKVQQGAPVVGLYFDYQCPACASFEQAYGGKLTELSNTGAIQLQLHNLSFLDTNLRNDASMRSANAAMCAAETGHYLDYHNAVFANQPQTEGTGYTDEQLTQQFTAQAGITGDALNTFNQCYSEKKYDSYVNSMDEAAGKAGITGTPTLTVNGKPIDNKSLPQDPNALGEFLNQNK